MIQRPSSAIGDATALSGILVCPRCRGNLARGESSLDCPVCNREYSLVDEIPQFDMPDVADPSTDSTGRNSRRSYWDEGWAARYQNDHAHLALLTSRVEWMEYLQTLVQQLKACRHVSYLEAGRQVVQGKLVLDIGCGGGVSSAFLAYYGAR